MNVNDMIIKILDERGIEKIFTYMSEEFLDMLAIMKEEKDDIQVVDARHEQGAVAMADGYCRSTKEIGVCIVGRGPAIAQTGTALTTANKKGSKLLLITSETSRQSTVDLKNFKQESYLNSLVGDNLISIRSNKVVLPKFREAIRRVDSNKGPVVVQVSHDIFDTEIPIENNRKEELLHSSEADRCDAELRPGKKGIREALDLYLASDSSVPPVILAGRGAMLAQAKPEIERLAEKMNAILVTTLQTKGYFSDHPFYAGFMGGWGMQANTYVNQCDYLLAIGCSLNNRTTDEGRLIDEQTTLVQIDSNPYSIGRYTQVDLGITGDARITVRELLDKFENRGIDFSGKFWTEQLKNEIEDSIPWGDREFPDQDDRLDPREFLPLVDSLLPENRFVITDGGHFTPWVLGGIEIPPPDEVIGRYISTLDFNSVGQGLPQGIGAAIGASDATCVVFCGDGGFMMSIQELDTAVRHDVPMIIFVYNDAALGAEYHQLGKGNNQAARVESPNIAGVAREIGADGYSVSTVNEINSISNTISEDPDGPIVIDCKVNREIRHPYFDQFTE